VCPTAEGSRRVVIELAIDEIPEKWYPYKFDIWGSSHQIMHCMVVYAGIAHLLGLLRAFDHIHGQQNICAV
jgi:adiponectin receptor